MNIFFLERGTNETDLVTSASVGSCVLFFKDAKMLKEKKEFSFSLKLLLECSWTNKIMDGIETGALNNG